MANMIQCGCSFISLRAYLCTHPFRRKRKLSRRQISKKWKFWKTILAEFKISRLVRNSFEWDNVFFVANVFQKSISFIDHVFHVFGKSYWIHDHPWITYLCLFISLSLLSPYFWTLVSLFVYRCKTLTVWTEL